MIIYGIRRYSGLTDRGTFHCPGCNAETPYELRTGRNFLHIYFIPLIPASKKSQFVRCKQCKNDFIADVLNNTGPTGPQVQEMFFAALTKVTTSVILADEEIDPQEIEAARNIIKDVVGADLSEDDLLKAIEATPLEGHDLRTDLSELAPHLTDNGKEMLVRVGAAIALADRDRDEAELQLVRDIAIALGVPLKTLDSVMEEVRSAKL